MTTRALLDHESEPDRGRDPDRDLGGDLSLYGLQEHRQRGALGGRARGRHETGGVKHGHYGHRHDRTPDWLRSTEAQGGRAVHPRQGDLPRRHPPPRNGARRDAPQPLRPRPHRLDRHLRGARPSRRRRGRHRQGPRDARARLDADDLLRHPGGARRRQGPLPGAGGGVRDRRRRVHGPRRARADRRRVRAAARGRQRAQGARPGRAADPRRQGGPARQPGQPAVGGRRRGRHRSRVRRGGHDRHAGHHLPALPPGAARDVRDDRRLQPEHRPARHLQRQPGAERPPHGVRARGRPRRAHDPDPLQRHRRRLRQQGAGVSGLRVRDRRRRSSPASRSSGSRTARRT